MSKSRHTEAQMIGALKQVEAGRAVEDVARELGALDFAHDAVAYGRAIRVLSVVDAYTRECLALEVDTSVARRRVTRVLETIVVERDNRRRFAVTMDRN